VRRVRSNGEIKEGGDLVFLSESLIPAFARTGIAEIEPGDWLVRFADVELGAIGRNTKRLRRFMAALPAPYKINNPEQTGEPVRHVSGL